MPPRKQASKKSLKTEPQIDQNSSFTPQNFEDELKKLAKQAKGETWLKRALEQVRVYGKAASILAIIGVYANVSLLSLSPVYGGIPAAVWHSKVIMAACFLGWSANLAFRRLLPTKTTLLLPLIAAYIPMVQFYLFKFSGSFTANWGPLITELLTLFPLMVLSVSCVADILEEGDLSGLPKWVADCAPGLGSYSFYKFIELLSADQLQAQIGRSFLQTRVGLELVLAGTYTIMAPSKLLLFVIPGLLHAAFFNTHVMTPMATQALNSTLLSQGWSLVDRWESVTGYISILDSHKDGFRVMRCDHSLLGGEWTKLPKYIVGEPIYSVFTMLEAVRLVEVAEKVPDNEAKALNIGLGIGTTPSALIAHGIDTTIVEIDPVVYDFAVKYFGLPSNHTAVIEDAVGYTARIAEEESQKFDYIIHDVFTGGAEPIPLFTLEFLQSLNTLLKPDGVIALNYAGDFTLPPLSTVVRTVKEVFPSCRIFRENPAPSEEQLKKEGRDFDNMVIFCRKTTDGIAFRRTVEQDFLRSRSRQHFLAPKYEVDNKVFLTGDDVGIVRKNDTSKLGNWHDQTGLGHWAVMRTVLPKEVWENW
ncbi:spermine/spermidine synthase [Pseudomassariella vexata]|uniref:Spermine/spermidine synthase n=1 Tax=Pseudomassariella vexata TaxID=1141098 RepID=A0A1Y2DQF5_9PEZI|nr:spermine/spermidine synthase [Pseudomassariella vexata]ORY61364.1 spermine/spermidine synthase [Pseudomassariella vexata]